VAEHAVRLAQGEVGLGEVAQAERAGDGVEGVRLEGQRRRVGLLEAQARVTTARQADLRRFEADLAGEVRRLGIAESLLLMDASSRAVPASFRN